MPRSRKPAVKLTRSDHERLSRLAASYAGRHPDVADVLPAELDRARVVEDGRMAADVVRVGSTLRFTSDLGEDKRVTDDVPEDAVSLDRVVTCRTVGSGHPKRRLLIHPEDGMWPPAKISVTTPLGITLFGLSAGDRMAVIGGDVHEPPWVEVLEVGGAAISGFARRPAFTYDEPGAVVGGSPWMA